MNDSVIMNQNQSVGIIARVSSLGFGRTLGPWAFGPGLGPDHLNVESREAAAWAQARAQSSRAQSTPKAQVLALSTGTNALAPIHDDYHSHVCSSLPNASKSRQANLSEFRKSCHGGLDRKRRAWEQDECGHMLFSCASRASGIYSFSNWSLSSCDVLDAVA